MEQTTALYPRHQAAGGKLIPFAGWLLPVEYPAGLMNEHKAVRTAAGLFDVSHMGEVILTGPGALASLNHLMTNDFTNLAVGKVRYSPMCNDQGGVIDDLLVYRLGEESFLVVVNAANRAKDVAHMQANLLPDTKLEDRSDSISQLALQGPKAPEILARVAPQESIPKGYYSFTRELSVGGIPCLVSRTGYTGELGYELYCAWDDGPALWDVLMEAGRDFGLLPCGLGARDTLRLEAAMPLYGHEMDDTVSPLETGLDFGVKLNKAEFIGREALLAAGTPKRARVGLKATSRGILREHQDVYLGETCIGHTTSGTFLPTLNGAYAMALVEADHAAVGTQVWVDVRGRKVTAEVVPLPFYKRA